MTSLFVYGVLLFLRVAQSVTGYAFRSVSADLYGYECKLVQGHVYPGVIPAAGKLVRGAL